MSTESGAIQIEVISGPGATLWGANAVNGVINIITQRAAQTQGALVSGGGGDREQVLGMRYGGKLGTDGHFRAYAKRSRKLHTQTEVGAAVSDAWENKQIGFRAEWSPAQDAFVLQGDAYDGTSGSRGAFGPVKVSGANLLARWQQKRANGSGLRVQVYADHMRREDRFLYQPRVNTVDLEFQQGLALGNHRLLWGGGHRRAQDDIRPGLLFGFEPVKRTLAWTNLFAQDEIALASHLNLVLGAKLERNSFTGWEFLPSLRLAWRPAEDQLLWASASRAVRAPARLDRDIRLPAEPPFIIAGGPDFESEVAQVLELGYRSQPSSDSSFSVTLFQHRWDGLRSGQPPPNAHVQNMIAGKTFGLESWGQWQALPSLRLSAGLTVLRKELYVKEGSTDPVGPSELGNDPERQWTLRSSLTLPYRQELDLSLRRVSALPNPLVPAYTAVDLRYGWWARSDLELSLTGRNLFDRSHVEFGQLASRSAFERAVLLQLRWTP